MSPVSVVIITRNEEHNIVDCVRSARMISDDIIVVDAESSDQTATLAQHWGAKLFSIRWNGYGYSRNYGAERATHDWILALDADERIGDELASSIQKLQLGAQHCIYHFRRHNYLGNKRIRFGTMGFETVKRLYNRKHASWDLTLVHERLQSNDNAKKLINGHIEHFGFKSFEDYKMKATLYAQMSAEKYFLQNKRPLFLKKLLSPLFNSIKSYFFQFGFLDGKNGLIIAQTIAYYSWLKYFYLQQLEKASKSNEVRFAAKPQVKSI